jgi:hypothetical protein
MQRPPRRDSSRAPSAARQPRRCAPESGGAQWSAAWTCSAGGERVGPAGVPGKGGLQRDRFKVVFSLTRSAWPHYNSSLRLFCLLHTLVTLFSQESLHGAR